MSQNDALPGQQEQFYEPGTQDMGGRTQTRFPQANQKFAEGGRGRPGSA